METTTLLIGTSEGKIFIASSLYGDKLLKVGKVISGYCHSAFAYKKFISRDSINEIN